MASAKLKFRDRELTVGAGNTTIGRTSDNDISFTEDSNISRYHARIEPRGDEFWIADLGSSNGTTVNGTPVNGDMLLRDGDEIMLGGSSGIEFRIAQDETAAPAVNATAGNEPSEAENDPEPIAEQAEDETAPSSSRNKILVAVAAAALIGVLAIGGVGYYLMSGPSCVAAASFSKPEAGETIIGETEIELSLDDDEGCVARAVYFVDGKEVLSSSDDPFTVKLDSNDHPDLADGYTHSLAVLLIDEDGNPAGQSAPIALAFETRRVAEPKEEAPGDAPTDNGPVPAGPKDKEVTLIAVNEMASRLAGQFKSTGNFRYTISNKQFLQEVQKMTKEYAQPGFFDRAAKYRDAINVAYVRENNIDASFGFILAMSRSKFDPVKKGSEEGLWRMTQEFAQANAYNGLCGVETLSDPSQNCAAKSSANYMKALVLGVFDGDLIYSAAAFGKSPQDAIAWKATLPVDRSDVWNSIKTAPEREQLIRFFAAALVADNPEKFGLKDRPLSELYKLTL